MRAAALCFACDAPAPSHPAGLRAPCWCRASQVIRCSDGVQVDIPSLWGLNERAVVVWARTFGWWVASVVGI
jgi:hypothetical protein